MVKVLEKEPYTKTEFMPTKFRGLLDLVRPFTLIAPFLGGIGGAMMALVVTGQFHEIEIHTTYPIVRWNIPLLEIVYGSLTLVIVNAASNTLNQVYDFEIDVINKPYRPLPMGVVTKEEALTLAWILYLVTLWRASLVNATFAFFTLLLMIITILYSLPPVRLKKRLWLSNLSIAVPRGLLGFLAAWSIVASPWHPVPWALGSIMALFLIGAMTTKDFTDISGDAKFEIRTLPVVYGVKKAAIYSAPFFILPFVLVILASWSGLLIPQALYLGVFLMAYGAYLVYLMLRTADTPDPRFENSPVWKHMYLMLMAMFVGFPALYILTAG